MVQWPDTHKGNFFRYTDAPPVSLPAGAYDRVEVHSGAAVELLAGDYFFESLIVEPQARLRIDTSAGTVKIYVRNELRLNASPEHVAGNSNNLLVVMTGSGSAYIGDAFAGSILAPSGRIELRRPSNNQAHRGTFWGREIDVASDAIVLHVPFPQGVVCDGPFNGLACTDDPASAVESTSGVLFFPKGTPLEQAILSSRDSLDVAGGVQMSVPGSLVTSGAGTVTIVDSATPGVAAIGKVTLQAGASVDGDASSASNVQVDDAAGVTGTINRYAPIAPADTYPAGQLFPEPFDGDYVIQAGRSRIIFPGNYGSVTVEAGGKIYLTSGEYTFENLSLNDESEVGVNAREGWVTVAVKQALEVSGHISPLGDHDVDLSILYLGKTAVPVDGQFRGTLIAPSAPVNVSGGQHRARFYGATLSVGGGAQFDAPTSSWGPVLPFYDLPDVVAVVPPDLGLPSTVTASDGTVATTQPGVTVSLPIAERLPVEAGNAGQGNVTITFVEGGVAEVCTYEGQSPVANPTTLAELAYGKEYLFQSCSNGAQPGDVLEVTNVEVSVTGADLVEGGVVIDFPTPDCENVLPPPLPLGESRRLVQEFEWPSGSGARVHEFYDSDKPALYYSKIYITRQADLDLLDTLLIHWSEIPLFEEEWPLDWDTFCGTIHYPDDGEGMWVSALIPGTTYNVLLDALESDALETEEKERIPRIRLLDTPAGLNTSVGSLDLEIMYKSGFRYLHLDELPDDEAIDVLLLEGKGAGQFFGNLLEFVGNAVRGTTRALQTVFGAIDKVFGTVKVDLDVDVLSGDARFDDPDAGEATVMKRAWTAEGREIAPHGARLSVYNSVWRLGGVPFVAEYRGELDSKGRISLKVGKAQFGTWLPGGDWANDVKHLKIGITLNNDAAKLKTFVIPSTFWYKEFNDDDFNDFNSDSSLRIPTENWNLGALTEMTDAHEYVQAIVGKDLRKAETLIGGSADVLGGDSAWAPCMGYSNGVADIGAALSVLALHLSGPNLDLVTLTLASVLGDTDISISPRNGKRREKTRGLMAHEYGHFAFVGLLQEAGDGWNERTTLSFDSIAAGQGNPDPDEEVRVVNEAFADFFCGQVGSCSDYFEPDGSEDQDVDDGFIPRSGFRVALMVRHPGMDQNIWERTNDDSAIGRLTTMMHDLFDGRTASDPLGPNSADGWAYSSIGGQIRHSGDVPRRARPRTPSNPIVASDIARRDPGDTDAEAYMLGGPKILSMLERFREARIGNSYSVSALERGAGQVAVEEASWCQACQLMAPHFVDETGLSAADLRQECATNPALAAALGNLEDAWRTDLSCSLCDPGEGVSPTTGNCEPCVIDEELDWSTTVGESCTTSSVQVTENSGSDDNCPMDAIVGLTKLGAGDPPLVVGWDVLDPPSTLSCGAHLVSWDASWTGGSFGATATQSGSDTGTYSTCSDCASGGKCRYTAIELESLPWEPTNATLRLSTTLSGPFDVRLSSDYGEDCEVIR